MKKRNFLILLLLVSFSLFSQTTTSNSTTEYRPFPVTVIYGCKFLQNSYFNRQLNSFNNFKPNGPISMAGVCLWAGTVVFNPWHSYEPHLYYSQILPQSINVNDSSSTNLTGFQFGAGLWGRNFFRQNNYNGNIAFTLGFNAGRLKFFGNENINQANSFFSPKVTIHPWIRLWRIKLSVLIDYEYDISNKNWKNLKTITAEQLPLEKLSHTGFTAQANIGYFYVIKSEKDKKIAKNKKKSKKRRKKKK